jgi:Protein of unknown function (DUF998)
MTRTLLACGILAGPLYMAVYLGQALTRPGFDITRHPASVLSNGDLGWIQVANFLVCGGLVMAAAIGMRRALRTGRGRTWGPILIGLVGVGMILAAIFTADPVDGFPPGTPLGPPTTITRIGLLHFASSLVGFSAWIAATFVFARRFAALRQPGWAIFSTATGALLLLMFIGSALAAVPVMGLVIAIALAWVWLSANSAKLLAEEAQSTATPSPAMTRIIREP